MIVGFTGTREGLTNTQIAWLYHQFEKLPISEIHHGACVGADASVHAAALEHDVPVHVWPPVNQKHVAAECLTPQPGVFVHPTMPYLHRNREIVNASMNLIAFPKQNEQPSQMLWGGTWYTVNFAERMGRAIMICYPNGVVEKRI
jgi:hypothetical protein